MRSLLLFWVVCALALGQAFAAPPTALVVDDQKLDVDLRMVNEAAMVPFRPVLEACGATAHWVADARAVSARTAEHSLYVAVGSKTALVDGYKTDIDPPAQFIEGRAYLPLRLIVKALNFQSMYSPTTGVFYIFTKPPEPVSPEEMTATSPETGLPTEPMAGAPEGVEVTPPPEEPVIIEITPAPGVEEAPPVAAVEEPVPPAPSPPPLETPIVEPGVLALPELEAPGEQLAEMPTTIIEGRGLVPVRLAAERLGGALQFVTGEKKAAILRTARHLLEIRPDDTQALFDGSVVTLPVAPRIVEGSLIAPATVLAAAFDGRVIWVAATKTAVIAAPRQEFRLISLAELQGAPQDWVSKLVTVAGKYAGPVDSAPLAAPPPWGDMPAGMIEYEGARMVFAGAPAADLTPEKHMGVPLMVSGLVRVDKAGQPYLEIGERR